MRLGELLDSSWKEYTQNWKEFAKFIFLFRGLPALVFGLMTIFFIFQNPGPMQEVLMGSEDTSLLFGSVLPYMITMICAGLILGLLYVFVSGSIVSASLQKNYRYDNLVKQGSKVFGSYLLYTIVLFLFLIGLYLLLIIPGIIFTIFWILSAYALMEDKERKIIDSLKTSFKLVKNNWWRTFGYLLVLVLIMMVVSFIFGLISTPTELVKLYSVTQDQPIAPGVLAIGVIMSVLSSLLAEIVTLPLFIIFFKNYYLDRKKAMKTKKK